MLETKHTEHEVPPERFLPKTIHAIWAGGAKSLPNDGIVNLVNWSYLNPGFKVTLWIDPNTLPMTTTYDDVVADYKKRLMIAFASRHGEALSVEFDSLFEIRNIRESGICETKGDDVDYAIDRLDPNYGLSSDILRYRILYKYGGVYIDSTDVMPGSDTMEFLSKIKYANFDKVCKAHMLYVDHLSQQTLDASAKLPEFELQNSNFSRLTEEQQQEILASSTLGNDSFICTKGNPIMLQFAEETRNRLRPTTDLDQITLAYGGFNTKDRTIELSGPDMVKSIILDDAKGRVKQSSKLKIPAYTKSGSYLLPLKHTEYVAVRPPAGQRNSRNWNNVGIDMSRVSSIEDACIMIVKTAAFEIENMGIFRLEDHMQTLSETASLLGVDADTAAHGQSLLFKKLGELPLTKVNVAQAISDHEEVAHFYERHGLSEKIFLNTRDSSKLQEMLVIWECVTSFGLFMGTKDYKPETLATITKTGIEATLRPKEIVDVYKRLDRGVTFINKITRDVSQYPQYETLVKHNEAFKRQYCNDVITKYMHILDAYTEAFVSQDINPAHLNKIGRQIVAMQHREGIAIEYPDRLKAMLKTYKAGSNIDLALRRAAHRGGLEDVKYLTKYADINGQGATSKKTALHLACEKSHTEVVKWLLECGADNTIKDKDDKTPIAYIESASTKSSELH